MAKLIKRRVKTSPQHRRATLQGAKVYAELRSAVVDAGLLKRSYGYYAVLAAIVFFGFFTSGIAIVITQPMWLLIIWAVLFSFFAVQVGGFLHDAGHRALFQSPRVNDVVGHICGFLLAQSYGYWQYKHNKHHAHPNQEGEDEDIDLPIISFTQERYARRSGIQMFLRRYQVFLYYPIGLLAAVSPRYGSIQYFRQFSHPGMIWEIVLTAAGMSIWFFLPFIVFDLQKAILIEVLVNGLMGLYLLQIFAPNHKGMPELEKGVKMSFLEQQVITSRNIHGHWLTDIVYIGLNYQMEHHLFPTCPRNNLGRIAPFVKDVCKKMNLPYIQVSVLETNKIILSELNKVAKAA